MAVIEGGTTAALAEVGSTFKSMNITQRPLEYGTGGTYMLSVASGTMAAGLAASAEIFQLRWTHATKLCVIHRLVIDGAANAGTAFAAGVAVFQSVVARSWSADGSGGTAVTTGTNNQKARQSMAQSDFMGGGTSTMRISSTAALTAGTKTFDSQGFGQSIGGVTATAGAQFINGDSTLYDAPPLHDLVLATNEGFAIRATVPATGTWTFGISIRWSEVTAY